MRTTNLSAADRLIVAADFKRKGFEARQAAYRDTLRLCDNIGGTGVAIKSNSVLRAMGYGLGDEVHKRKLRFFADLKLYDIPETLELDGEFLAELQPEFVTVALKAGTKAVEALKNLLPQTKVLGITIPTSMSEEECQAMFGAPISVMVPRLAIIGVSAGVGGLVLPAPYISSVKEALEKARFRTDIAFVTPAIRPTWGQVAGDDQNPGSVKTPAGAIKAGADYLVVGRPITKATDVYEATTRTIEEIGAAM